MTYQNDNFNDRNFTTGNTELPDGEYRYYKDRIYQDAASEQAQQTAASGYTPPDANKKSTGRKKKGTALLLAGCLVLSMVGGAGGAVIAAKSGLLSTGSAVLYQGVEVPSSDGSVVSGVGVSYSDVVQRVEDSVVAITTESISTSNFFRQYVTQGAGSGVVLTTDGYIVTNYHVIEGASDVQVLSQGRYLKTEIVGYDELTDLAVLRVMEDIELPAVKMGDMSDVRVGDWAIVIGNPLGKQFADTVTVGVVSALNRELESSSIVKMLQTDAAINSGNSGGGLFNTRGELIGIPSLKFSSNGKDDIASIEGIAMAIPVDVVQPIVNSIIQYGKVTRPKLGISVMTIRGSEKPTVGLIPAGVYVSAVAPESTAERAGIKAHDIIIGMDGERIALHTDLTNRLAARSAGDVITLTIYRIPGLEKLTVQDEIPAGEELEIQITLEMPSQDA